MKIHINGEEEECMSANIAELVRSRNLPEKSLVVEVNRQIIGQEAWSTTQLEENDEVELLQFVGGG